MVRTSRDLAPDALVLDPRYRLLDIWRGVACLMVVLHHAGLGLVSEGSSASGSDAWLRKGIGGFFWLMNLGVPLFFVISGYCIMASSDATRRRGATALKFLGRRVWRIYPPYWVAVACLALMTFSLDRMGRERLHAGDDAPHFLSPGQLHWAQWAGNLTLTEEWRPQFWSPPSREVYTRVAWSLCFEEQFYFVCFFVLLIAPRRLYGVLLGVTVGVLLLRLVASDIGMLHRLDGLFPSLWHEFAVGIAVYWRLAVAKTTLQKRTVELSLLALAVAGLCGNFRSRTDYSTVAAALFGLSLIVMRRWDEYVHGLAWLRPLRACGLRCYSIYLFHFPVVAIATQWLCDQGLVGFWPRLFIMVPITSAAGVGMSWLFFGLIERHFLNPPIRSQALRAPAHEPLKVH